jgi:hypothetical protein
LIRGTRIKHQASSIKYCVTQKHTMDEGKPLLLLDVALIAPILLER